MKWFRDVSVKRKLTLVILLSSFTVLLLACISLVAYEVSTFRAGMAQDMTVLADVLGSNSTGALAFENQKDATDTLSSLKAESHVVAAAIYNKDGNRFADYIRAGATAEFPAAPPPDGYHFESHALLLAHPIMQESKRIGTIYVRADLQRLYDRLRSYGIIVALVMIVAVIATLIFSIGLQRLITRPILALTEIAKAVAERKDYSVRGVKGGRDEIGLLADAMNQMLSEIETGQRALREANQSLEDQASQLQQANRSLEDQAGKITETVGVLGASSTGILALSTQVAARAIETATAVTQTTTTVEEVKQTALFSSQRTRQVFESAQRVVQISQSGTKSTEETVEGMKRIHSQMQLIADSMARLSEQTLAVGDIIATVEDLAQQSNLLSVNAAIEAAKAGEHGRGFAVVAQEVKSLSEQSRQATTQVRTILNEIRKAANAAVMATEQGTKAVEAGVRQSGEAGQSIVSLASNVAEAAGAAEQIAASSQQQLLGMDQVATAMESIKQASKQNADSGKQLETAARDLSTLGER